MIEEPLVSVIIPTKNSANFLDRCLKSVRDQTYKNIEIIVVDNNSTDKTKAIAQKYADKVLNKGPERSAQVNHGIKVAEGRYIYRVDSDFVLDLCVIEEAVHKCELEGLDGIAVHNTSDSTISFWSRVRKLERDCYKDDDLNVAARFVRKDVFERIGGFDEALIAGEDYDLHNRLVEDGARIGRIKAKETHIGEPTGLWQIAKKHYFYGQTISAFLKANPKRGYRQLSPMRWSLIRKWAAFIIHPLLAVGFIIYQSTRYLSAGLGLIVATLFRRGMDGKCD